MHLLSSNFRTGPFQFLNHRFLQILLAKPLVFTMPLVCTLLINIGWKCLLAALTFENDSTMEGTPGTQLEPETGATRTLFPGKQKGTRTSAVRQSELFSMQKPEPDPYLYVQNNAYTQPGHLCAEEPFELKTGTAGIVAFTICMRTELRKTQMATATWPLENGTKTINKKHPDRFRTFSPVFARFRPFSHFVARFRTFWDVCF